MEDGSTIAKKIIDTYIPIIKCTNLDEISSQKSSINLPQFSAEEIEAVLNDIQEIFSKEPTMLEIPAPVHVIGDLHGHILDLFRDLQTIGFPVSGSNKPRFLFLGDLVDRGEFSLETVTLVFSLKVAYPDNIFIIRGNHEFEFLNKRCGFVDDISKIYGNQSSLYDSFKSAFSYLPITALINKTTICVHGGLGPNWFSLSQAKKIERPINDFGDELLDGMLWSDPSEKIDYFEPSNRGTGFLYGESVVADFLDSNSIKLMIRAHECVNHGYEMIFGGKLITLFGASNYCGLISNSSAIITFDENGEYSVQQLPPLFYLKRDMATFQKFVDGKLVDIQKSSTKPISQPTTSKWNSSRNNSRNSNRGQPPNLKLPPLNGLSPTKSLTPRNMTEQIKVHKPIKPATARTPRNHFRIPQ